MTARYSFVSTAVAVALFATSAFAGWTADGVTIKATTSNIPQVAAANDGTFGSYVVWQEESAPGSGVLRAQHVLPTGDLDAAWPAAGFVLCNVSTQRAALGLVEDGLGGAYVWWKEGAAIYLSRLDAAGPASGWPARGRSIGTIYPAAVKPSVISDGANGIYIGWATSSPMATDPVSVLAIHLGPSNTGAGGWPNGTRGISGGDPVATWDYWPSLALAPDGGLFVAWAKWSEDAESVPSAYRLRRVTSAGLNAAGWDPAGVDLGLFHGEWLPDTSPETGLVGIAEDGAGGVYANLGILTSFDGFAATTESRLFRLQGDGSPAAGWPAAGVLVGGTWYGDVGAYASHRAVPDGLGGVHVGRATYYDHGTDYSFTAMFPDGEPKSASIGAGMPSSEFVSNGNGGLFVATCSPKGPYGMYDPWAFIGLGQSLAPPGWTAFTELHFDIAVTWYGDTGLAATGDGGAFFFWSQVRERFGLFARRFNGAGQVTGVPPLAPAQHLALDRLRFAAGEGVIASFSIPAGETASLELFDVTGRRVAASRIAAGGGGGHVALSGTRGLASGLYFAKLATRREAASGRVVVTR